MLLLERRTTTANKVASSKVIEIKINWTKARAPSSSTFKLLYDTKYMEVIQASHLTIRLTLNPRRAKKKREKGNEKKIKENGWEEGRQIPRKSNSTRSSYYSFIFLLSTYVYTCTMYSVSSTAWLFFHFTHYLNTPFKDRVLFSTNKRVAKVEPRIGEHTAIVWGKGEGGWKSTNFRIFRVVKIWNPRAL